MDAETVCTIGPVPHLSPNVCLPWPPRFGSRPGGEAPQHETYTEAKRSKRDPGRPASVPSRPASVPSRRLPGQTKQGSEAPHAVDGRHFLEGPLVAEYMLAVAGFMWWWYVCPLRPGIG
ncbi:hypothetical protein EYF80_013432 [Liparis tanakae]|uniref:Uncharacterized protein n=1 Tax=Liparis tanakae TaxID=230148 RepID=A0A4Z2IGS0_9TELE|nr:hypothetical protein EYF80_013432 [Liparis tanakae]